MRIADGTYKFTSVPLSGPSHYVIVTVKAGLVASWAELSQDGQYRTPATVRDLEHGENYMDKLRREIEVSQRLAGLGHPQVEFVAAEGSVAA